MSQPVRINLSLFFHSAYYPLKYAVYILTHMRATQRTHYSFRILNNYVFVFDNCGLTILARFRCFPDHISISCVFFCFVFALNATFIHIDSFNLIVFKFNLNFIILIDCFGTTFFKSFNFFF